MGVPGLWDVLRPAGELRSLTHLAVVDGFESNQSGTRGLRIGIDASIWFFHATYGKEGENPELRTLFFRCARLMAKPLLPLFVFDGPKRPDVKRKKKVSGKQHWLTNGMQQIIEAFGFEWRMAPGEAEAELAYLNRIGVIDAILSDDVDNFLFGAKTIIRNPGKMLSGNHAHPMKNAAGKEDDEHVYVYTSERIAAHEDIGLTVGGLILIGLLRGGDYNPEGLPGCGPNVAHALARCGFGDTLIDATRNLSKEQLPAFLTNWRHEVRQELKTNSRGFLNTKKAKLAKDLPETFPDINILLLYTNPITSESERKIAPINYRWEREPDLGKIANVCEWFFEWGVKEIIVKRFRTVIWPPIVLRILRRAVLDKDSRKEKGFSLQPSTPRKNGANAVLPTTPGTPSRMIAKHFSSLKLSATDDDDDDEQRLIRKIHSKRTHASTDGVLEYRLEIAPAQLVRLTEAGVEGRRKLVDAADISDAEGLDEDLDEDGDGKKRSGAKKPPPDPLSHLRIWMPASMVSIVEPELVESFEDIEQNKARKRADAAERKALKAQGIAVPKAKAKSTTSSKNQANKASQVIVDRSESEEDFGDVFGISKGALTKRKMAKGFKLRETLPEKEEDEEELECDMTDKRLEDAKVVKSKASGSKKIDSFFVTRKSQLNGVTIDGKRTASKDTEALPPRQKSILFELSKSEETLSKDLTLNNSKTASSSSTSPPKKPFAPFPLSRMDRPMDDGTHRTCKPASSSTSVRESANSTVLPASPSKRNRGQTSSSRHSDIDESVSSVHKSPRKNKTQTSPNFKAEIHPSTNTKAQRDSSLATSKSRTRPPLSSSSMKPLQVARDRKPIGKTRIVTPLAQEEEESSDTDRENERPTSPSPFRQRIKKIEPQSLQAKPAIPSSPSFRKQAQSRTVITISSDEDGELPIRPFQTLGNTDGRRQFAKNTAHRSGRAPSVVKLSSIEVIDLS